MPTFTVRCVEVRKKLDRRRATRVDTFFRGQPIRAKTYSPQFAAPSVKAKATGPLAWVTLLGFSLSIALFILSFIFGDGMSLLATILLSLLSTLVGMGNKWSLRLAKGPQNSQPPPGDVVIRYSNGSYLVVKCEDEVARELYFAPEEIEYSIKSPAKYRLISLVGTLMLMLGVICLANARLQLQFAWAGAYIIINIAQWIAAALPPRLHWDLSCYEVREQGIVTGPKSPTFTDALWKAIMLSKSTRWVKPGNAAPSTEAWDAWSLEAKERVQGVQQSKSDVLIDPQWPKQKGVRGIVWEDPDEWHPREAWKRYNEEQIEALRNGAPHPTQAV